MKVIHVKNKTKLFGVLAFKYDFINRIIQCLNFTYVWLVINMDRKYQKFHRRMLFPIRNETKCVHCVNITYFIDNAGC